MGKISEAKMIEQRREFIIDLLGAGFFAAGLSTSLSAQAGLFGKTPRKMPAGKSIFSLQGSVFVNDKTATLDTLIKANDTVRTGRNGKVIFVVGRDAFTLRSNSEIKLSGSNLLLSGLRLLSGGILSVFGRRRRSEAALSAQTTTATIGIRGTGLYMESEPDLSYICTCYGITILRSAVNPKLKETIVTKHHDSPRYVYDGNNKGPIIQPAPMKNHTDLELMVIEELMGRTPPFGVTGDDYITPKRRY